MMRLRFGEILRLKPDKRKNGGEYISVTNSIKQIDLINNIIILTNKKKICINDIIGISGI